MDNFTTVSALRSICTAIIILLSLPAISAAQSASQVVPKDSVKQARLEEVRITGYKSANEQEAAFGKAGIKAKDLPQAITIVDHSTLEQQQAVHISDALKNVNGLYIMGTSGAYQEELAGRGYAYNSSNTFKNGVRFNNTAMPELSALERIEVLKGSNAILFGNVAPGGAINLVTKKPTFERGGEIKMIAGSYDFYKPSVDLYGAVGNSKHLAYRLNASYENAGSFRNGVQGTRYYVNPSLLIRAGKKTDVLIEGDYLKDDRTADFGTGAVNYRLADIPRERFLGTSWSYFKAAQSSLTATVTHRLSSSWQLRVVGGAQAFRSDLLANTRPNNTTFIQPDGKWIRGAQRSQTDEAYYLLQADLTGQVRTGSIEHKLLIGADADQYLTSVKAYNNLTKYDSINIYDLNRYAQRTDIPTLTEKTLTESPIRRSGLYAQDLISLTGKIKLLAGIRYTYMETGSKVLTYSDNSRTDNTAFDGAFTPRIGIVYQPVKNVSLFASYANAFTMNTGVDVDGNALKPSYIDQYEAGAKTDLFRGLITANATVYRIVNSNLAQTSAVNPAAKELAGEVTSQGVEIDLISRRYCGFSVIAGYSYNDTRYTASNTYEVGSRLRYNPSHTANASLYYAFCEGSKLKNLNLGVSVYYVGDRVAGRSTTTANPAYQLMPLPAYTLADFTVGYAYKAFGLRVRVSNSFDVLSYNVHDDNSVNPIAPRMVNAALTFKF